MFLKTSLKDFVKMCCGHYFTTLRKIGEQCNDGIPKEMTADALPHGVREAKKHPKVYA